MRRRPRNTLLLLAALTSIALAPSPAAAAPPAPTAAATPAEAAPAAEAAPNPEKYAARLKELVATVRAKALERLEQKILDSQAQKLNTLVGILRYFSFAGLLLLLLPFYLRKKYPDKMRELFKYSAIAAVTFLVTTQLVIGSLVLLKVGQSVAGTSTNPQIAVVRATFDTIDTKAKELAVFGPALIEPTLSQLSSNQGDQPLPVMLIENVQRMAKTFSVFQSVASFFKSMNSVFGLIPMVMMIVACILFGLASKPLIMQIVRLPERAVSGEAQAKEVVKEVFRYTGREMLAVLCLIATLIGVTILSGQLLSLALKPAVEAFLAYLFVSVIYVQVEAQASAGVVLFSLSGTIIFLALNLGFVIVASALYLSRAQKVWQQRFHGKIALKQNKRFWMWGTLCLTGILAFPAVYILGAKPLVELLIRLATGGESPSWTFLLLSGPATLVGLFLVTFWAARGFKALKFLATCELAKPAATPAPVLVQPWRVAA